MGKLGNHKAKRAASAAVSQPKKDGSQKIVRTSKISREAFLSEKGPKGKRATY